MTEMTADNIVSLADHSKARKVAPQNEVETYWTGLLNKGDVPLRSDVDPRAIENALEYAFVAERVTSTMSRLRVAGAHLSDLLGMSVSGMPLACMFTADARPVLAEATDKLFNEPAVIHIEMSSPGATQLTGELVLLPLRSDLGDVTRALGCFVTEGRIGRAPRRFDITRVRIRPIASLNEDGETVDLATQDDTMTKVPESIKSMYLKLVVSND